MLSYQRINALMCFVFLFINITNSQKFDKIQITVYYDAAGNSSAALFTQQITPAYPIIGDRIILRLVPYCLSAMQPGSDSYRANAIHVCAFCRSDDQKVHLDFATCMMKDGSVISEETVQKCADEVGLSYEEILKCAQGADGRGRLANNGFATRSVFPRIFTLPAIANNGWVNPALQTRALTDFLGYVCSFLNNPPAACPQIKG